VPLELTAAESAASQPELAAGQQQVQDVTRRMVSTVTFQRLIDLARPWLGALVASVVFLYSLGDPVYGFLQ
jgi:hypothetical protein